MASTSIRTLRVIGTRFGLPRATSISDHRPVEGRTQWGSRALPTCLPGPLIRRRPRPHASLPEAEVDFVRAVCGCSMGPRGTLSTSIRKDPAMRHFAEVQPKGPCALQSSTVYLTLLMARVAGLQRESGGKGAPSPEATFARLNAVCVGNYVGRQRRIRGV
jgi:hypothetical protein